MKAFRAQRRLLRIVPPFVIALTLVLVLSTFTSWAANTIGWTANLDGSARRRQHSRDTFADVNNDGQPDLIAVGINGVARLSGQRRGRVGQRRLQPGLPVAGQ